LNRTEEPNATGLDTTICFHGKQLLPKMVHPKGCFAQKPLTSVSGLLFSTYPSHTQAYESHQRQLMDRSLSALTEAGIERSIN
jgi:hypothetical protein